MKLKLKSKQEENMRRAHKYAAEKKVNYELELHGGQ